MSGEAELARQLESALERIEELEAEHDKVAEEFEGDCWKAMRRILTRLGYEFDPYEGTTADDAEQFIVDSLEELEASNDRWETRVRKAEQDLETLRAGIKVLKQGENE